jgi:uncharacterized protein (DUF1778 family)
MGASRRIIQPAKRVTLTERDSLRVLQVLEKPPQPNARLLRAARRMPKPK